MVDTSEMYYNISYEKISSFEIVPLYYLSVSNTSTINNKFQFKYDDDINVKLPKGWIYYDEGDGINCLSGNTFIGYALYAFQTDITSCFRKRIS